MYCGQDIVDRYACLCIFVWRNCCEREREIHRGGLTGPGPPTEQTESESREFKILLYVLRLEQELAMMLRLLVINTDTCTTAILNILQT